MPVVIAVGIPGVGKTSVINSALELAKSKGLGVKVVNFGDVMVEQAVKLGLIASASERDKMRKLSLADQLRLQKSAAEHIYNMSQESGDVVIVDTHVFIRTPSTFLPGIPKYILDALKPRGIIVIEASPEEVLGRRAKDADVRDRDVESVSTISLHQDLTLFGAAAVSIYSGANLTVIDNDEGKLKEAAEKFLKAIESMAKL
ncbi:MAG: adenylate kinase [Candidatus Njordarchaeia archaeon]